MSNTLRAVGRLGVAEQVEQQRGEAALVQRVGDEPVARAQAAAAAAMGEQHQAAQRTDRKLQVRREPMRADPEFARGQVEVHCGLLAADEGVRRRTDVQIQHRRHRRLPLDGNQRNPRDAGQHDVFRHDGRSALHPRGADRGEGALSGLARGARRRAAGGDRDAHVVAVRGGRSRAEAEEARPHALPGLLHGGGAGVQLRRGSAPQPSPGAGRVHRRRAAGDRAARWPPRARPDARGRDGRLAGRDAPAAARSHARGGDPQQQREPGRHRAARTTARGVLPRRAPRAAGSGDYVRRFDRCRRPTATCCCGRRSPAPARRRCWTPPTPFGPPCRRARRARRGRPPARGPRRSAAGAHRARRHAGGDRLPGIQRRAAGERSVRRTRLPRARVPDAGRGLDRRHAGGAGRARARRRAIGGRAGAVHRAPRAAARAAVGRPPARCHPRTPERWLPQTARYLAEARAALESGG